MFKDDEDVQEAMIIKEEFGEDKLKLTALKGQFIFYQSWIYV